MNNQEPYRYWKNKRHVIHFSILMATIALFFLFFFIYVFFCEDNSPFVNVLTASLLSIFLALIAFLIDFIFFLYRKNNKDKPVEQAPQNQVEIKAEVGSPSIETKEQAEVETTSEEKQEQPVFESNVKVLNGAKFSKTALLTYYGIFWSLVTLWLLFSLIYSGIVYLININHPKGSVLPIIIGVSIAASLFILFYIVALWANYSNSKTNKISDMYVKVYKDRYEYGYHEENPNTLKSEIKMLIYFRNANYMETKKYIVFKGIVNRNTTMLLLEKDDPDDVNIIEQIKKGIKAAKGK